METKKLLCGSEVIDLKIRLKMQVVATKERKQQEKKVNRYN